MIVSIMQTKIMAEQRILMHEQAKASVWPRLEIGVSKSHNIENYSVLDFKLYLENNGVGPAIITDVRVSFDEDAVEHWWELIDNFQLPDSINTHIGNAAFNKQIVRDGELVKILDLEKNLPIAQAFYEHLEKVKIEVCYESIYGDKWCYSKSAVESKTSEGKS